MVVAARKESSHMKIMSVQEARDRSHVARGQMVANAEARREAQKKERLRQARCMLVDQLPVWMSDFSQAVERGATQVILTVGQTELASVLQCLVCDMFTQEGYITTSVNDVNDDGDYGVRICW